MNRALWAKAVADAWRQLVISCFILVLFAWVFVWIMSWFPVGGMRWIAQFVPAFLQAMLGVPLADLATRLGQLSLIYVHLVTMLVCVGWALGRGADSISGEIGRGTMDLVLTLPVWRATVMIVPGLIAAAGTVLLVASIWLGTALGVRSFDLGEKVDLARFLPGAVNLFFMVVCLTGITTLISSWNNDRWRTVLWSGSFFVLSLVVKMIARAWEHGKWLNWVTFLSLFQPQELILLPPGATHPAWHYNAGLLGIGLFCYALAGVVFWRRDIPAPR